MKRRKVGKAGLKPARGQAAGKRGRPPRASAKARAASPPDAERELGAARAQLAAISDILRVIAAPAGDTEGSLRKIAEITMRLFGAAGVSFRIAEGDEFKLSVGVGQGAEQIGASLYADPAVRPTVGGRNLPGTVVRQNRQIHLPDIDNLDDEFADWPGPPVARRAGIRTMIGTPLRTGRGAIGALMVYRNVLRAFEPVELQLLQSFADQAVIAFENARLFELEQQRSRELAESLEQQTATSEVLGIISSSAGDLKPVFNAILANAARLCEAQFGNLLLSEGGGFRFVASHNAPAIFAERWQSEVFRPGPLAPVARAAASGDVVHVINLKEDPAYLQGDPPIASLVDDGGARTLLIVPLIKDAEVIGALTIFRREVRSFTDKQIDLVRNFAAQAVIAMENARLLAELRESLEQQTATADVLKVISRSAFDLQAVFDNVVESSSRLCSAERGFFFRFDGEVLRTAASCNVSDEVIEWFDRNPIQPDGPSIVGRCALTRHTMHIADTWADPDYKYGAKAVETYRSFLAVPVLKGNELLGVLALYQTQVRPFTEKQIALVETFADQAAIAIENVRLFEAEQQRSRELTESLTQQTATADVLKTISRSTFDLQTVLDTLTSSATKLCAADEGAIWQRDGELLRMSASYGVPPEAVQYALEHPLPPGRSTAMARAALERRPVHIRDVFADPDYSATGLADAAQYRTALGVPLLRDGVMIGAFALTRTEVNPFVDKQIELVTTFADQAVIAIENARLLGELRESLEQQTATADVLQVISSSQGELGPVFQAMLENATRICSASFGTLLMYEGDEFRRVARHNMPQVFAADAARHLRPPFDGAPSLKRLVSTKRVVHITDMAAEHPEDPIYALGGARSILVVPMIKDGALMGCINVYRREVRPFTDKQIELLTNFAAQAVIAIENARLLSELRESLEQQTATSEVLRVISSSPGDLEPVFDAILQNATRICGASFGNLELSENGAFRVGAMFNAPTAFAEQRRREPLIRPHPLSALARVVETKRFFQVENLPEHPSYKERFAPYVHLVEGAGARTLLVVPLLKEDELVGVLGIYRQEVAPFTEDQIALVQNFAAQAVIAIENARLLSELREALEQQTATADILKVIASSPSDVQPVFDAVVLTARRLLRREMAAILLCDDNATFRPRAITGPEGLITVLNPEPIKIDPAANFPSRAIVSKKNQHFPDWSTIDLPEEERNVRNMYGLNSSLYLPMVRGGDCIGVLLLGGAQPGIFSEADIALAEAFRDQAVIAIENTRLLGELRESLEQQTATAEVLRVISRSPGDLGPVFASMLENAVRICGATFGTIYRAGPGGLQVVATQNMPAALAEHRHSAEYSPAAPQTPLGEVVATRAVVHVADMAGHPGYTERRVPALVTGVEVGGVRTWLGVPMVKDDELIGAFVLHRQEMRPFSDKQIALVTNFANQAVIAIENARLLTELRVRTDELSRSVSELRALGEISQAVNSTLDLENVLETIVAKAVQLSNTDAGAIYVFDDANRQFHLRATYGMSDELIGALSNAEIRLDERNVTQMMTERALVQVADFEQETRSEVDEIVLRAGYRARLVAPLFRGDDIVGLLVVRRRSPGAFAPNAIDLMKTFAAQSAVAIQNARLYANVETRTRELAASLADLRTAQDRLVQTEKLASLGQLTAGIAHEIKNPLNFVNNFSSLSAELIDELTETLAAVSVDDKTRADIAELASMLRGNLEKVVQHGKRADSIVKNMLLHSRQGAGEHQLIDVNALVEESLNLAYHGARAERQGFNITLERSFDPDTGKSDLFPQEITRVLLNLISNGFYAATKRKAETNGGTYEPVLSAATKNLGDRIEIRIRDNGTGIPPGVREKMFNPFFTTKPAGEGTGLGLSLSHDIIVKQHAGSIEVDSRPGEFTEFRIVLPRRGMTATAGGSE